MIFVKYFLCPKNSYGQECTSISQVDCDIAGIPCGTSSPTNVIVKVYIHNIKNTACEGGMSEAELSALKTYLSSLYSTINITLKYPDCILDFCDNDIFNNPLSITTYYSTRSFKDGINAYISTNLGTGDSESIPGLNFYSSPHNSTVAHELGHCLGLAHTFVCVSGIRECADKSNGTVAGDLVCDTNADPEGGVDLNTCTRNSSILLDNDPLLNPNCNDVNVSCNGTRYDPPSTNIMSYYYEPGGANCQLIFTPGQAERMKIALATCPVLQKITSGGCIEVKTSDTWDTDHTFDDDLLIKSGVTLTVKAKVKMATGRKISLEGGAILRVDGGILTVGNVRPMCDRQDTGPFWKGVELGVTNGSYAHVYFTNLARMEYSYSGLFNVGQSYVSCLSSQFLNNRSAVDMETQSSTGNIMTFTACTFILNNSYPGSDLFHQIRLSNGQAQFALCTIDNQTTFKTLNIAGIYETGTYLSVLVSQKISGYYFGINALAGQGTYNISGNHFEKCHIGLQSSGVNGFSLIGNTFIIGKYGTFNSGLGMQMDFGSQFVIKNNNFVKGSDPNPQEGLLLNKSHATEENYISSDNLFSGLSKGINLNGGPNENLYITCNDFTNCTEDIFIKPTAQIHQVQNFNGQAAGNTFSQMNNTYNYDNVLPPSINYWYNGQNPIEIPIRIKNIFPQNHVRTEPTRCYQLPIDPPCCPEGIHDSHYYTLLSQIDPLEEGLNQLLDSGHTQSLLSLLESANLSNAASIFNTINLHSPNVSSQVIRAVWLHSELFSGENRYQLILSNPVVLIESSILSLINELSSGITPTMVENLNNTLIPSSGTRYNLVMQLKEKHYELDKLNRSMANYHSTNTPSNLDHTLKWLERSNSSVSLMEAALIALNNVFSASLTSYLNQLNAMQINSNSSATQYEINQFLQFINTLIPIYQSGRFEGNLTQTEQTSLLNFATAGNSWAHVLARGILAFYYNIYVTVQSFSQENANNHNLDHSYETIQLKQGIYYSQVQDEFEIFPNPFKDELIILSLSDYDFSDTMVELVDLNGKLIRFHYGKQDKNKMTLVTDALHKGMYILRIFSNEKIILTSKVIK